MTLPRLSSSQEEFTVDIGKMTSETDVSRARNLPLNSGVFASWKRLTPAVFMLAWGGNHFTPLLQTYQTLGNYAPWQTNLLLGMYVFGLIPGLLVASALSDRYGRKTVLAAGLVVSVMGSILLACGLNSFFLLCLGRVLAGVGVGVAMSVGTSWIKELSSPPFDLRAGFAAGARRPALTLTLGFGVGAAATGSLAQWGPIPETLPFVIHAVLCVPAFAIALTAPETRGRAMRTVAPLGRDLRLPTLDGKFVRIVLPAAPWVFAAAGVAYAIIPATVEPQLGGWTTLYATILTVLTLGTGALIQSLVPTLDRWTGDKALSVGLALMVVGMALSVLAASAGEPIFGFVVALILGAAYGICVVAGLMHVQAMAGARNLAGLTGIYYALTYTGFLLPTGLALLLPLLPYTASLAIVAAACLICFGLVTIALMPKGSTRGQLRKR